MVYPGSALIIRPVRRLLVVSNMYPSPSDPSFGIFVKRQVSALEHLGVECDLAVSTRRGGSPAAALRKYGELGARAIVRAGRHPGAVLAHYAFPTGAIGVVAGRRARCPVAVVVHGTDVSADARRPATTRRATREVLARANLVVAVSRSLKADAIALGARAESIIVASMGYDEDLFHPGDKDDARRKLGLDPGTPIAVFVGGLTKAKGIGVLIDAAARLRGTHSGLRWVLVGAGDLAHWKQAAAQAGVEDQVEMVGPRPSEEIPLWFQAADLALMPSLRESFGVAALEALACGTPVVASATGGLPEFMADGVCGLLVPPGDPEAFARAVFRLAIDRDLRERLGAAGPAAAAPHTARRQARLVLDALDQVAKRQPLT